MPFATPAAITDTASAGPFRLPLLGLLALSAAACTDVVTDLLPAGLLPQMGASLRVPDSRIGYLVTAFAIASAVAAVPVMAALVRIQRRVALIGALVGIALCNCPASFALLGAVALVLVAWVRWAVPIISAGRVHDRVPLRMVVSMPGIRGVLVVTFFAAHRPSSDVHLHRAVRRPHRVRQDGPGVARVRAGHGLRDLADRDDG
jgi:predicted MFS family arabinose efflux permease